MNTYNRIPVDFVRGEGSWLYDTDDNKYLDAISGIAVCALGHNHPGFIKAVQEQVAKL
ncbi:MAG: aminotransferase class III-fold pyridoxal phosphate-dependent enzyme, partial [Gammaproteobacteria bacterium]|nr:aminotransferase class III-fold pyridoxal phosphate-dependent enzyme [Gammaproteobacteria bacterium]